VVDQIVSGKSASYREASETLHVAMPSWVRRAAHYHMLQACGFGDLIRADFYRLFAFPAEASGHLLDAGCGSGIEAVNLRRLAPELRIHGVDVSSIALAGAVARPETGDAAFYQAALERLPFPDAVFDYIASHEVIEHVEDPAVVVRELGRMLRPGGVCVIATPNGASLWFDHLRQRVMRLFGRRGAPVGADHTRSPAFWPADPASKMPSVARAGRPRWLRYLRRGTLLGLSLFYAGFLLLLAPLALAVSVFHQPFRP
jgi:2-polyprenyl-3-methyl-5-hydroxy-6-metoxy-1,4-benzoquinol methylase